MRGINIGGRATVGQEQGSRRPLRVAVVSVIAATAALLLTDTIAAATNLSSTAAQMASGTFVELTGMTGWDNGGILTPSGCGRQDAITQYANTAVWNPIAKRFQFSGSPHASCSGSNERATYYDDATNTWGTLANPCSSCNDPRHSYGHNAMNPANGDHYYHNYNSNQNLVLGNGASGWTALASVQSNVQCCNSQAWFPDRNTLVRWDGDWGLWEYSRGSNAWTERAQGNGSDGSGLPQFTGTSQPTWTLYSARCHCIVFGNGPTLKKFNSDGTFTTLTHSGGPSSINITPSGNASVAVDPVQGMLIFILQGGTMQVLDPGTSPSNAGAWSTPNVGVPSFFNAGNGVNESLISAPIPTYGVVMYVKHDDSGTGRVFLYKHAPSTPQIMPGVPSNVAAR